MNNENKKKSILFLGILVAVLTCLTVGFAYAYYRAVLKGEKENKVVVSGATVVFTEPDEALESTTLIKKGETFDYTTLKSYDFSVDIQSKGDTKLNYQVEIEPLSSSDEIPDGYYLLGDANRDAEIKNKDVTRCQNFMAGSYQEEAEYLKKACDVNKDGSITQDDIDILFQNVITLTTLGTETFLYGKEADDNNKYVNGSFYIGDATRDGLINVADGVRCSRYIEGYYTSTNQEKYLKQACDMNKDGVVNTTDTDILSKYLANSEVEQPIGTDAYKFDYKGYTKVSSSVNSVAFYLTDENNNPVGYTGTTGKTASELRSVTSTDEIIVYKSKVEFTNGKLTSIDDVAQSAGLASYKKNFKLRAFAQAENDGTVTTTTDGNRHEATSYVVNYKFKVNVVAEEAS